MDLRTAYKIGKDLGASFIWTNQEDISEFESAEALAFEVFDNYIEFSPWEFTGKEFNESRNPDRTWEEFFRGLEVGARREAKDLNLTFGRE